MMKVRHNKLLGFLSLLSWVTQAASVDKRAEPTIKVEKISIGVLPNERNADLKALGREMTKRLGVRVEWRATENYQQLLQVFKDGSVEFAFFPPLMFVEAEREAKAKALLKKVYGQNEFYYSAIIVRADSQVQEVKDLVGKTIAFVDPKSSSGYLYPRTILRRFQMDAGPNAKAKTIIQHIFTGTHESAVEAVTTGKAAAAAVWADGPSRTTGAWNNDRYKNSKAAIRILAFSDPIPNDAFVVRREFHDQHGDLVLKLMFEMIDLADAPNGLLRKYFDVEKLVPATSRHYDAVRTIEELTKVTP